MKMIGKWSFVSGLMAICFFLMTPSESGAVGGDSWKRQIRNYSPYSIWVSRNGSHGNVWFESGCAKLQSNPNGPCEIAPNTTVQIKYTTTAGESTGVFYVDYPGIGDCSLGHYSEWGKIKVGQPRCGKISGNDPGSGDFTIR